MLLWRAENATATKRSERAFVGSQCTHGTIAAPSECQGRGDCTVLYMVQRDRSLSVVVLSGCFKRRQSGCVMVQVRWVGGREMTKETASWAFFKKRNSADATASTFSTAASPSRHPRFPSQTVSPAFSHTPFKLHRDVLYASIHRLTLAINLPRNIHIICFMTLELYV